MAIGDVDPVTAGGATDLYCIDIGMYDEPAMGAVYLLDADRPAVVDTGLGKRHDVVLEALETVGVAPADLAAIALTHVHLDHAGGAGYLAAACPDAEVYVHPIGAPHVVDPEALVAGTKRAVGDAWRHYAEPQPVDADRIVEVADGDAIDLGDRILDVHEAPGHAPHQVVFHNAAAGRCYVGDAAGLRLPARDELVPTTPPPNFDFEANLADIDRLRSLSPAVLCYPHFGAAPTAERLDRYERILTEWVEAVAGARESLGDDEAVMERFVEKEHEPGVPPTRGEIRMNVAGVLRYLDGRS